MFINNFSYIKSKLLICSQNLGKYIISRNIPLLSINEGRYIFIKTDLIDEIIDMLPEEYRKEHYEYT